MHKYTVALRISGETLDAPALTQALGIEPTHAVRVGEARLRGLAQKPLWSFEVFPTGSGEWDSLEDGLQALLRVFASRIATIRQLQQQFEVFLWCGHFSSSFDGGPRLSAQMLKTLGDFGVELYLDSYSHSAHLASCWRVVGQHPGGLSHSSQKNE